MSKENRSSNIELLRIIAALGVFVLHYNFNGGFQSAYNVINENILIVLENIFIICVNLFVLISGYFLCTSNGLKYTKIIELLAQVIIMRIICYGIDIWLHQAVFSYKELIHICIPNNYYVILYITLYLLHPFLNMFIDKINKREFKRMLFVLFGLFSVYPTLVDVFNNIIGIEIDGLSSVGRYGSQYGYSIVNFILLYLFGAYIRKWGLEIIVLTKKKVFILIGSLIVLHIWHFADEIFGKLPVSTAWEYCNPIIIIEAITVFCIFKSFKIRSGIINFLAKASFTFYLIHATFLKYIKIDYYVQKDFPVMLFHIVICGVGIYIVSVIIWFMWDSFSRPIFRKLSEIEKSKRGKEKRENERDA